MIIRASAGSTVDRRAPRSALGRRVALVVAMAAGSIALWTLLPLLWLGVARALASERAAGYVVALIGCVVSMWLWGCGLFRLGSAYERLAGRPTDRPRLLETLIVASAILALAAFLVRFFVFAGSPSATPWPDELSGPGD